MVTIVSHDAGGAEILSSWVLRQTEEFCLVVDGPAKDIFKRKLGKIENTSLEKAVKMSDWILTGTSWQSNLERRAIILAKDASKKVITFLDHWVNYMDRFVENKTVLLPNEIWVGDREAEKIAKSVFIDTRIVLKENPYFEDIKLSFSSLPAVNKIKKGISVLYLCDPIREHALLRHGDERYWGYTEEDALKYFLTNINAISRQITEIKIRPHPSEKKDKYNWAIKTLPLLITSDQPLLEEIAYSDVIVGGESMAMVIGILANKRVVSCIPPCGIKCRLPYSSIEHLYKLIIDQNQEVNA